VNADDPTGRLLEAAVPPIPAGLRIPPYERIRARARRRRVAQVLASAAAVLVIIAGLILATTLRPGRAINGPATAPPPPISPTVGDMPAPFLEARVSRSGTQVTVYINPPGNCTAYTSAHADALESDIDVRIMLVMHRAPADCDSAMVTTATVTLPRPIGGRTVIDGSTGGPVPTFFDANLPRTPAAWTEVHVGYTRLEAVALTVQYTATGGPDLIITASPGGGLDSSPVERVRLGSHDGVIVPGLPNSYDVDWMVGDLLYQMRLEPGEGQSVSLDQVHAIIAQLAWP
jgi:hypothetical protein